MRTNWFQDFRLKDLTWWINTTDYKSKIEDKQSLILNNWGFKWNKLVSSKWIERIYNWQSFIQWFTKNWDDIWHIENSNLYKNWSIEYENNQYKLFITNIDWKKFDIEIDWNKYVCDNFYNNESLAYSEFVNEISLLLWTSYVVTADASLDFININRTDWLSINFIHPDIIKNINISSWTYWNWINITIDWINIIANQEDYATMNDLYLYIKSQLPINTYTTELDWLNIIIYKDDLSTINISSIDINHYSYVIKTYDRSNPSWYNLWWVPPETRDVNTLYVKEIIDWVEYSFNYPNWLYWPVYTFSTNIPYYWWVTHYSNDSVWTILYWNFYNYILWWWTNYSIISSARSYNWWTWTSNWYTFSFKRNDWQSVSISWERKLIIDENLNTVTVWANSIIETNQYTTTITITNYSWLTENWTIDNVWLDLSSDDFYDLTVSRWGILIVSKRWFNPTFIDIDWNSSQISTATVWQPTCWTIYKWKIILWWYDNDNIVFWKTDDPVSITNKMLEFSAYSAWRQSISWWNRWVITWFKTWENWLYVFKENEVWYTNTEKDTWTSFNFVFSKITSNWASSQQAIHEVWQEIFYFDYINRAVRRLSYEQNLTTLRDSSISKEVEDIFKSIPENWNWIKDYSQLISTSYIYPYFDIHITTDTSEIFELYWNRDWRFKIPNKTLTYNVDNKSWSVRTDKNWLWILHSFKWCFATNQWDIYKDQIWNTLEDWDSLSKEYVFIDDVDYKRIWEFEIIWDIIWDWWIKNLEIELLMDWENLEIWESTSPYKRIITAIDWETNRFREKIDLFDDWRFFQFKLWHNWNWYIEISEVNFRIKPLKITQYYY